MNDSVADLEESKALKSTGLSSVTAAASATCPVLPLTSIAEPTPANIQSNDPGKQDSNPVDAALFPLRDEATSQHLAGTVELTVIANLKSGLIDVRDTLTYATRLRLLLRTLNGLRKEGTERAEDSIFPGPIEHLQTIHHVSWTLFDNEQKMLMSVIFDQALEPYIRKLVGDGGPVLNAVLCHCEGYNGEQGYVAFTDFVRRHQVGVEILAASVTGLTVDDTRYLKALEQQQRSEGCPDARDLASAKLHVKAPLDVTTELTTEVKSRSVRQALKTISYMQRLDGYFPVPTVIKQGDCTADNEAQLNAATRDAQRDRRFFLDLVKSMLPRFDTAWIPADDRLRLRYASELNWYETVVCAKSATDSASTCAADEVSQRLPQAEIQGNILSDYKNITHGCLLLLRLGSPASARRILQTLQPQVTTGATAHNGATLNIALTYNGLKTLGLSDTELVKFPKEFREGMQARASLLGDIGANHPSKWNLPQANWPLDIAASGGTVPLSTIDLVVQLQTANVEPGADRWTWCAEHPLYQTVADLAQQIEQAGGQLLGVEPLRRKLIDGKVHEHFGFRDGLSQPDHNACQGNANRVALGEVLLGHANDHNDPPPAAQDPLLHNSTFMVLRKLSQNVPAFEQFLDGHGEAISRDQLAAKMMGRNADGTPIVKDNAHVDDNDFDFAADADGLKCPFHAHIRRTNPRDAQQQGEPVPRILRRGIAYGPRYAEDPMADRGLMFMAYNASIAQQFEVIQRWISGGNSTGVLSGHSDPLLGVAGPGHERAMSFAHNNKVLRYNLGDKPFVKLEWGMYMFVPSISGLQKLCATDASTKPYPPANLQRGGGLIAKFAALDGIEPPEEAVLRWKKLLEDRSTRRYAEDVWAAIRAQGGALRTPYGVLVADQELIMEAMRDQGERFSVREFYPRMQETTGLLYLGIDAKPTDIEGESQANQQAGKQCPVSHAESFVSAMAPVEPANESRYEHESKIINPWIANFCPQQAFTDAREQTAAWLARHLLEGNPPAGEIKLKELVRDVLGQLAAQWFGLPDDGSMQIGGTPGVRPHCPEDFKLVASYVFYPNPTPFVQTKARERGRAVRAEIENYVTNAIAEQTLPADSLVSKLHAEGSAVSDIVRSIGGVTVGFVSPTTGSLLSALYTWIDSNDFWRQQQAYLQKMQQQTQQQGPQTDGDYSRVSAVLKSPLIRAMQESPTPPLPHRTAVQELKLGNVLVKPGERIVLGIVSAALQQLEQPVANDAEATRLLFGGNYGEPASQATAHACPGQSMSFGAMLGIISTLFELEGTLRSTGALTLTLNERD